MQEVDRLRDVIIIETNERNEGITELKYKQTSLVEITETF